MSVYSVDTTAVTDTASRVRGRIATIQTEVDAMQSDLTTLQTSWTGAAADSMATCASDWHLTQLQVQTNLDDIGTALDQSALSYEDAENTNYSRFGMRTSAA